MYPVPGDAIEVWDRFGYRPIATATIVAADAGRVTVESQMLAGDPQPVQYRLDGPVWTRKCRPPARCLPGGAS